MNAPLAMWERKLGCLLLGHDYRVWQHFSRYSRRVYCERCQRDWAMNDDVYAFVPWDADFERLYETLGKRVIARDEERSKR